MRKLLTIALVISCTLPRIAYAQDGDSELPADERIKMLMYSESDVYTITTRYGYQTNIVFDKKETIETISVGDRSLWQIIPAGNRLFIRPMEEDIVTNMTVLTNRRSYQFDLKSVAADKTEGNIYVARFVYPDTKPKLEPLPPPALTPYDMYTAEGGRPPMTLPPPENPSPAPVPVPPDAIVRYDETRPPPGASPAPVFQETTPLPADKPIPQPLMDAPVSVAPPPAPAALAPNYNYTYAGPDDIAPLQVYDDGRSTYFKYRDLNRPLPSLYVMDVDGKEKLVDYYVKDDFLVADVVAGEMILRNQEGEVRVYNELVNPR